MSDAGEKQPNGYWQNVHGVLLEGPITHEDLENQQGVPKIYSFKCCSYVYESTKKQS